MVRGRVMGQEQGMENDGMLGGMSGKWTCGETGTGNGE